MVQAMQRMMSSGRTTAAAGSLSTTNNGAVTTRRTTTAASMQLRERLTTTTSKNEGGLGGEAAFDFSSYRHHQQDDSSKTQKEQQEQEQQQVQQQPLILRKKQQLQQEHASQRGPRLTRAPCNERLEYCPSYSERDCPLFLQDHGTDSVRAHAACSSIQQCEADCASDAATNDFDDTATWNWNLFWNHCYRPDCQCQAAREAHNFYAAYPSCGSCVPDCMRFLSGMSQTSCSELCGSGCLDNCRRLQQDEYSYASVVEDSSKYSRTATAKTGMECMDQCIATSLPVSGHKEKP